MLDHSWMNLEFTIYELPIFQGELRLSFSKTVNTFVDGSNFIKSLDIQRRLDLCNLNFFVSTDFQENSQAS